jgi:hypothetical protein
MLGKLFGGGDEKAAPASPELQFGDRTPAAADAPERAGGGRAISSLDRNANIFNRVSDIYRDKAMNGTLRVPGYGPNAAQGGDSSGGTL